MWRCSWLLIAGREAGLPAYADTACVANEKGNTVDLIDTCRLQVVKTIRTGRRPRGLQVGEQTRDVSIAAP
jgi:YVTN family beta-propeller protein